MSYKSTVKQLLDKADIHINGTRPQDLIVHNEQLYKRVIRDGELGFGEAYMDGWWDARQVDELLAHLQLIKFNIGMLTPSLLGNVIRAKVLNEQTIKRTQRDVGSHYNIGNELYEAMLDKRMIYSCGYWKTAKTLDQAQEDKLDLICRKLHLKKGMTVLDIGCGWGGFSEYAARKYKVKVTGISPAIEQVKRAKARTKGLDVKILQKDYREVTGKFDRIVSIGMLEHVGVKNYQGFFDTCNTLLKPGGLMLHHTIGSMEKFNPSTFRWMHKYIFPGGYLPSLSQLNHAVEDTFVIEDVQNIGPDYDKTLMAWHKNFVKAYPKLDHEKYDERFRRMWEFYLLSCAGSFRARAPQLFQVVMSRKRERTKTYLGER